MYTRETSRFVEGFEPFVKEYAREARTAAFDEVESHGRVVENAVDKYIEVGETEGARLRGWVEELERSSDNAG